MLFHRENPDGIDFVIDKIQRDLFIELIKNYHWRDYDSYDRAYRNKKNDDKIPEVCLRNGEYKEVLFNDKEIVTSFFLSDEKRSYTDNKNFAFNQNISVIFQANLAKLYPSIKHRADEEMIQDIFRAIKAKSWEAQLTEVIQGFEKVYDTLKLSYANKEFDDMSSFCIARFNFSMIYSNTKCGIKILR